MMARASEERTARISGEDTPTAEANALRDDAEGLAPRNYSTQASRVLPDRTTNQLGFSGLAIRRLLAHWPRGWPPVSLM